MANPLIGPELGVNTTLPGNQYAPDVATLADGRSVVVWADGLTIKARFTDAAAAPSLPGGELVLATYRLTQVAQPAPTLKPKVAALADGGFAVAWAANDQSTYYGLGGSVSAQVFNADGSARSAPVTVLSDKGTTGNAGGVVADVDIAAAPGGGFAVVSDDDGAFGDQQYFQGFSASGALIGYGTTLSATRLRFPSPASDGIAVASTADGNYVVAFKQYTYANNAVATGAQIKVGEYAADGSTLIAPVTLATVTYGAGQTTATTNELTPTVAVLADGTVAVAWDHRAGGDDDIAYRILGATLQPTTAALTANAITTGAQTSPTLAALADGSFYLGWTDTSGGDPDIALRHFAATGTPLDAAYVPTRVEAGPQTLPSLATRGSNEIALAFQDDSHAAITGQTIDPYGDAVRFQALLTAGAAADARADNPIVTGTPGNDVLAGTQGDDYFQGGTGTDTLTGGPGNDIYDIRDATDQVVENPGEGTDTVYAHVSYTLPANVENLVLADTARTATGNAADNLLVGNDSDNVFFGLGGNDTMVGGKGNDTYEVTEPGDQVIEQPNEGTDGVFTYVDGYVLPDNVETLVLEGSAHTAIGNAAANNLIGGPGNDVFFGMGGGDYMAGGAGDDVYEVRSADDVVVEKPGEGQDAIFSYVNGYRLPVNVETLVLESPAFIGIGNDGDNTLIGNALDNVLNGEGGNDTLIGGAGRDTFYGLTPTAGHDRITDFDAAGGEVIVADSRSFPTYAAIQAAETQIGPDVVITLNAATSMSIANTTIAQLTAANFAFTPGPF